MSKLTDKSLKAEAEPEGKPWWKDEHLEAFLKHDLDKLKPEHIERPPKPDKWEKHEKPEKDMADKPPFKEAVPEKPPATETLDPGVRIDREGLLRHAESLEASARQLRHFIEQGERPDLSRGALADEDDS